MTDKQKPEKREIPPGQSPVRFIMSETSGVDFQPLAGFEAALKDPDGVAVFEGDYGGQIMMTLRMRGVKCNQHALDLLLHDLNTIAWGGAEGSYVYYERMPVGSGVAGGMGGGVVTDGVWLHARFIEYVGDIDSLYAAVDDVIAGRAKRIPARFTYLRGKHARTDRSGKADGAGAPPAGS